MSESRWPGVTPNWSAIILGVLLIYVFGFYAEERERTGYYRGLCTAGQGLTDEAVERCQELHP